jgi:uncharacterized protein DUF3168
MPFKDRLRTAALANAALTALIGSNWYDTQLPQTATFPAIVVTQISGPRIYTNMARLATFYGRFQFTIWGGQFSAGAENRDSVAAALAQFLDATSFDGIARTAQNPNYIVGDRDFGFPQTEGPIFQKVIDAMIFVNETL